MTVPTLGMTARQAGMTAFVLCFASATLCAQKTAALAGVVRDTAGAPLAMVTVLADSTDVFDVTGKDGRFFLGGLPAGVNNITVMKAGFRRVTFAATLTADSTLVIAMKLRTVATLAPISITAPAALAALKRSGFYDRERQHIGSFVTPQRVDSMAGKVQYAAELLRELPGVEVACAVGGCQVMTRRAHACLRIFVDGMQISGDAQIDEVVPLTEVGAVEVYPNPNQVPTEFQGALPGKKNFFTAKGGCGAIAVWTRQRLGKK